MTSFMFFYNYFWIMSWVVLPTIILVSFLLVYFLTNTIFVYYQLKVFRNYYQKNKIKICNEYFDYAQNQYKKSLTYIWLLFSFIILWTLHAISNLIVILYKKFKISNIQISNIENYLIVLTIATVLLTIIIFIYFSTVVSKFMKLSKTLLVWKNDNSKNDELFENKYTFIEHNLLKYTSYVTFKIQGIKFKIQILNLKKEANKTLNKKGLIAFYTLIPNCNSVIINNKEIDFNEYCNYVYSLCA